MKRTPPLFDTVRGALFPALIGALMAGPSLAQTPAEAPPSPATATPAAPTQAQTFTLSNGMTLIVRPDRRAPTVAHMLWVRVGAMDEVDGTSGVAHALEHLMFKGTPDLQAGEFSRRVAALGGRENAFTSRDATAYHQQVPASQLEAVMRLEADRFAHARWSDEEFQREIEVIKEERRQRIEEAPRARMFEALSAMVFQASPYRRPIIGWMSDIEAMTPQDARDFYQRWYSPANAAVVIAGDVDVAQVRALAETLYGSLPASAVPPRKPREEPPQAGPRRLEYRAGTEQAMVVQAWKTPRWTGGDDAANQDALALTVLAAVLDGYSGARLERALVQGLGTGGRRIADSAGASYGLMGRGPQLFTLSAVPAKGVSAERAAAALRNEVTRIAREGVTQAELQRVKTQWTAGEIYKLDSVFNQAQELGSYWINGMDVNASARLMNQLRGVTAQQVRSVAQRYFSDEQLTTAVLVPDPGRREPAAPRPAGPRPALTRH
ncbi:insulinase family protein [Hydrogenophaga taeniospiralis]|uniref:M16 family metallopeptidase n=1 Tax=Hydrogenophaga taeniospiralis TaxID=65656 RepID=UPI0039AECB2A|nr:insulinase family protein [Hydrogenophaga taeniospiralis]